ncbi:MAG: ribonuclease E/G [Alphaproteobacteria bacterium]|nr:ribonuclease E/G [Alphaproteobacteria bacterium]
MTKRMLIDASHAEETRVVVMDGSRLEEFDLEAANRLPLKGNIYLAKVVRVEPSLQAAFVEYGGNRHGFLAFSEIHPDYYQIPVADRQKLIEMQEAEAREEAEEEERQAARAAERRARKLAIAEQRRAAEEGLAQALEEAIPEAAAEAGEILASDAAPVEVAVEEPAPEEPAPDEPAPDEPAPDEVGAEAEPAGSRVESVEQDMALPETLGGEDPPASEAAAEAEAEAQAAGDEDDDDAGAEEGSSQRRDPPRFMRHYKIQEVIRRRQILLIQVVKEERGGKGAALTTYMSLAGRFSVLMPNSPRGGGVSRKITSVSDRRRLREAIEELDLPTGMSLIVRTAGAQRPKPEIKRDCEYLLRLWDSIRERTLASTAPALIYEEADLIKRSIRDGYARDMDEILVEGEEAYQTARDFMRMLMPENSRKIQLYRDGATPLFARHGVEAQLDGMHSPTVQLKSGGYIVINQAEALVAIDVNSGRSTRERSIEDTAFRTNIEAADEIARQLRLRDLAGLIVIDFIDMDASKHDAAVERRLKDALRGDRARIQVGRISHFGLLEMSRQRLRPSLTEQTFITCPHCEGRGLVRSPESASIQVLRAIEEEGARRRASEIAVHVNPTVAMYLLNRKRERLGQIEERFGMSVLFETDASMFGAAFRIEKLRAAEARPMADDRGQSALRMDYAPEDAISEEAETADALDGDEAPPPAGETEAEREVSRRRRRRRRGGRREDGGNAGEDALPAGLMAEGEAPADGDEAVADGEALAGVIPEGAPEGAAVAEGEDDRPRRRRGRRGGRRRREGEPGLAGEAGSEAGEDEAEDAVAMPAPPPRYTGPTPADPFASQVDPIMAAMDAAERAAEEAVSPVVKAPVIEVPVVQAPVVLQPVVPEPVVLEPVVEVVVEAPAAVPAPAPAPAPAAATPVEPAIGPVIQPLVIGAAEIEAPKKKGWWRR